LAAFPDQQQNRHDGVAVDFGESFHGSVAATLQKHPQYHNGLGLIDPQLSKRPIAAVDESLAAYQAYMPLVTEVVFATFPGFIVLAGRDNHCRVAFFCGSRYNRVRSTRLGESLVVFRPDGTLAGFTGVFNHVLVVLQIVRNCKHKIGLQRKYFVVQLRHGKTHGKAAYSGGKSVIRNCPVQIEFQRAQGLRGCSGSRRAKVFGVDTPLRSAGSQEPIQAGLAESVGVEPYRLMPVPNAGYKAAAPPRRGPLSRTENGEVSRNGLVSVMPQMTRCQGRRFANA
jgi:hypothetical protein